MIAGHWQDQTDAANADEVRVKKCEVLISFEGWWIAQLDVFDEGGPWYGNAKDRNGNHHRSGPMKTEDACREWCEYTSGARAPH